MKPNSPISILLLDCIIFFGCFSSFIKCYSNTQNNPYLIHKALEMRLLVSEPNIIDPVALAFDHNCQLYVAEMRDYPKGVTKRDKGGVIKLLSATNGDGHFIRITKFATNLS